MGVVTSLVSKLSKLALFLLCIALLPGLPPYTEFEAYSLTPVVPLEGALSLNSRLNNAERLFEGMIHGPEALHVYNGQLYTTVHGGLIVRIVMSEDGLKMEYVQQENGRAVTFGQKCDGFHEEQKCGRPLGLDFDKEGNMYVADAYYGIFKVNLATGKSENLVSINKFISGKRPMLPNGIAVESDGSIYWTDSSTTHHIQDGVFTSLANGNGRLIKYNPSSKTNTVLIDKLYFPNGVALSHDGSFLVVCESIKHRILKYHLKGPNAGRSEVFVDGLPGMPDNIRLDKTGGFIVALIFPRDDQHLSLIDALGPYPLVRKLLARLMFLVQRAVIFVRDLYPKDILKIAAHRIGHFESLPPPNSRRATVLFLTNEGRVSQSLHATDGLTGVSDLVEFGGYYYLGSPFNKFLARVKAN